MPSASTSARLAPLAPSPRNDTPCDVGLAVWLPDRRNSEKPATLRNLSSVASAPHCCNCVELTLTASGCASTSSTPVGRMAVRVAVTSRLCCTAAGCQSDGELVRSGLPRDCAGRETGCAHHESPAGGSYSSEDETAIGLGRPADLLPVSAQQNLRFGNHRAAAVFHHAVQFLRRQRPKAELASGRQA